MHAQHLLDAIDGILTPSAHDCLDSLTVLLCLIWPGQADVCTTPWLTGAPLTAPEERWRYLAYYCLGVLYKSVM